MKGREMWMELVERGLTAARCPWSGGRGRRGCARPGTYRRLAHRYFYGTSKGPTFPLASTSIAFKNGDVSEGIVSLDEGL